MLSNIKTFFLNNNEINKMKYLDLDMGAQNFISSVESF